MFFYDHYHLLFIPKGSVPHTIGDQIPETGAYYTGAYYTGAYYTGAYYSGDTKDPKTISGTTEAPRSTKAVEPIVHEGEQG